MKGLLRSALLHTTVTGLALSSLLAAGIASAQTRTLEEIVVTAQKRAQSVQDIPLAVSAISAETIAKLGIVDTTELVRLAPSLTVAQGDNKQNSSFRLRGIGTDVFSIGVEQSVAFIVDDVAAVQAAGDPGEKVGRGEAEDQRQEYREVLERGHRSALAARAGDPWMDGGPTPPDPVQPRFSSGTNSRCLGPT